MGGDEKTDEMIENRPMLTIHHSHRRADAALIEAFRGARASSRRAGNRPGPFAGIALRGFGMLKCHRLDEERCHAPNLTGS